MELVRGATLHKKALLIIVGKNYYCQKSHIDLWNNREKLQEKGI
jgi:hypothetical protein